MVSSRRELFRSAIFASSTFSVMELAGEAATSGDAEEIKLGVASYSFRQFQRPYAIMGTKKLGTPYINYKDMHLPFTLSTKEIASAVAETNKAGLKIMGGGNISFAKDDEADFRAKFEYAKAATFPLMVCAPTHVTLPKLEKYVKEYDIKIAIHNHGPEDKEFPTPQSVLAMVKNMDPRCGLCIDVGHTARTGVDVVESIALAGPRLFDMHVKDLTDFTSKGSQVACGDGKMPFPAMFTQLKKMKYQGGVMLEYEADELDPLPNMIKSFAYMRGVIAGLKG